LLRRFANKIGLSAIFTKSSLTGGESHQLKSNDKSNAFNNSRKRGTSRHMLSNPQATAWGSDEHILVEGQSVSVKTSGRPDGENKSGIVVAKEISIRSEYAPTEGAGRQSEQQSRTEW
jgi:hypothetical protein